MNDFLRRFRAAAPYLRRHRDATMVLCARAPRDDATDSEAASAAREFFAVARRYRDFDRIGRARGCGLRNRRRRRRIGQAPDRRRRIGAAAKRGGQRAPLHRGAVVDGNAGHADVGRGFAGELRQFDFRPPRRGGRRDRFASSRAGAPRRRGRDSRPLAKRQYRVVAAFRLFSQRRIVLFGRARSRDGGGAGACRREVDFFRARAGGGREETTARRGN